MEFDFGPFGLSDPMIRARVSPPTLQESFAWRLPPPLGRVEAAAKKAARGNPTEPLRRLELFGPPLPLGSELGMNHAPCLNRAHYQSFTEEG